MEIKQIWLPVRPARKNRTGLGMVGGVVGIALLAVALAGGGTVLVLQSGLPVQAALTALCLGVVVLVVALAVALGRRAERDATVFFLMEGDRLFVWDARAAVRWSGGAAGFAVGALHAQKLLRRLAEQPRLPVAAQEIVRVEHIWAVEGGQIAVCRVRRSNGAAARRTCFLADSVPDSDLFLRELERREGWGNTLEPAADRSLSGLAVSLLVCVGFAAVCVLSHPAVARLPDGLYFPCLGAAFVAFCVTVGFAVRRHRGE